MELDATTGNNSGYEQPQKRPDHRYHRPRRQLPSGAAAEKGCSTWHQAPGKQFQHLYRSSLSGSTELDPRLTLHYGDLSDGSNLQRIIEQVQPDEIYNLGAQSHVAVSFEAPEYTANVDALGTLRILEAVRIGGLADKTRVYQASTSELC